MLSGNSFSNQITVPADGTATDVAVLHVPPGASVGCQLTYVAFDTDGTDIESQVGLIAFAASVLLDGTVSGNESDGPIAEGGSQSATINWTVDTSRAEPVIQVSYTTSLTLVPNTALITYEVNYYGSTWAGGQFPGTVPA